MLEVTIGSVTGKMVLDSVSPDGIRLPTIQFRHPRMTHSDFLTHRVFTRNGRSSRAVPSLTLLKEAPYVPHLMMNQPGMAATEEFSPEKLKEIQERWLKHAEDTKDFVRWMQEEKVHKQWANRPLEWFGYIDVLLTSTDWSNFLELRDEAGAQPEIQDLAKVVRTLLNESTPKLLKPGEWHLPYIDMSSPETADFDMYMNEIRPMAERAFPNWRLVDKKTENPEFQAFCLDTLKRVSVARCARLTIKPFDNDSSLKKELERFDKLMVSRPVHASPAEHIATPDNKIREYEEGGIGGGYYYDGDYEHRNEWGNYFGWRQFRKQIPFNTIYDEREI